MARILRVQIPAATRAEASRCGQVTDVLEPPIRPFDTSASDENYLFVMVGIRAARTSLGRQSRRDRLPLLRDDPRADHTLTKTSETIAADENMASRSGRDRPLPRLPRFVRSSTDLRRGQRFRFHAVGCLLATPSAANTARLRT
jgi:hypothetical protein